MVYDKVALMVGYQSMEAEISAAWAALDAAGIPTTDEAGTPLCLATRVTLALLMAARKKAEPVDMAGLRLVRPGRDFNDISCAEIGGTVASGRDPEEIEGDPNFMFWSPLAPKQAAIMFVQPRLMWSYLAPNGSRALLNTGLRYEYKTKRWEAVLLGATLGCDTYEREGVQAALEAELVKRGATIIPYESPENSFREALQIRAKARAEATPASQGGPVGEWKVVSTPGGDK